ncbi:MAG TPA: subclass B3 metallo-beta-lactamase [Bryobacteraceae bacterium]|nr:subclass B3 metallo-beta-lactamase [Bryobacteraceae bacterium]
MLPLAGFAQATFPAVRIIGNLYYVGDTDLAAYLVVTPKGDILINSGFEYSVKEIRDRMKSLGFRFADLKILLATHAHSDHVAAMATIKRLSGARMMAIEQEAELLETGGKTDYLFGSAGWFPPVKVDQTFRDGDKIELGGSTLTAHWTPGHTKGSTSYSMTIAESGREYSVLIANLPNLNEGTVLIKNPKYPGIVDDYARTFEVLRQLPCDIYLTSHAGQFGLLAKFQPGKAYSARRFVDPYGLPRILNRLEQAFIAELEQQQQEEQAIEDRKRFKDVLPN